MRGGGSPQILMRARRRRSGVAVVGMNYYDAFRRRGASFRRRTVRRWRHLAAGHDALQRDARGVYNAFRVPVAPVAAAFHINDFSPGLLPSLPAERELTLVWDVDGAAAARPNIHPNAVGYAVIAGALSAMGFTIDERAWSGCRGQARAVGGG